MNQTDMNLKQASPELVYKVDEGLTTLPFNYKTDLDNYSQIFIAKQYDVFRIVHCCEAALNDYIIYAKTKDGDKKILFTCRYHYKCCYCCEQCICGYLCCGYACCDSIIFQMDYRRNENPFFTQGYNLTKGCHCCDFCTVCLFIDLCPFAGKKLYLRQNINPDSPRITVGTPEGKTKTNCCCTCSDKTATYFTDLNIKGPTVRADCCDICKNICLISCLTCGGCCNCCVAGFDFEMSIEDLNGKKTGNIMIYSGCCSEKVKGMMCYFPRGYMEVNLPQNATSEEKFQIIADIIHLDLVNKFF